MKTKARKAPKSNYRANFLWPHQEGSVEQAGYEFANGLTEEYRAHWWKILKAVIEEQAPHERWRRTKKELPNERQFVVGVRRGWMSPQICYWYKNVEVPIVWCVGGASGGIGTSHEIKGPSYWMPFSFPYI